MGILFFIHVFEADHGALNGAEPQPCGIGWRDKKPHVRDADDDRGNGWDETPAPEA